jgi:hypothetical protein
MDRLPYRFIVGSYQADRALGVRVTWIQAVEVETLKRTGKDSFEINKADEWIARGWVDFEPGTDQVTGFGGQLVDPTHDVFDRASWVDQEALASDLAAAVRRMAREDGRDVSEATDADAVAQTLSLTGWRFHLDSNLQATKIRATAVIPVGPYQAWIDRASGEILDMGIPLPHSY